MTCHRVYWPTPDDLYHAAHDEAAIVRVEAGEAVCVVDGVEWRARLAVEA